MCPVGFRNRKTSATTSMCLLFDVLWVVTCLALIHCGRFSIFTLMELMANSKLGAKVMTSGKEKARTSWARFRDTRKLLKTGSKCSHPSDGPWVRWITDPPMFDLLMNRNWVNEQSLSGRIQISCPTSALMFLLSLRSGLGKYSGPPSGRKAQLHPILTSTTRTISTGTHAPIQSNKGGPTVRERRKSVTTLVNRLKIC